MTARNKRPSQVPATHVEAYLEVSIERCDGCKRFVGIGGTTEYVVVNADAFMDLCADCVPKPILTLMPGGVE